MTELKEGDEIWWWECNGGHWSVVAFPDELRLMRGKVGPKSQGIFKFPGTCHEEIVEDKYYRSKQDALDYMDERIREIVASDGVVAYD